MKINKVSITGADDKVNPSHLEQLSEEYPFVEWAFLYSRDNSGKKQRYPSVEYLIETDEYNIESAIHICGHAAKSMFRDNGLDDFLIVFPSAKRFQFNLVIKDYEQLKQFSDFYKNLDKNIILQYTNKTKNIIDIIEPELSDNFHILYDSSGGNGVEIDEIKKPFTKYTGYAGGINPKNIEEICETITLIDDDSYVWIDMESGVRTDNEFDLKKVEEILLIASKYVS